MTNDQIDAWIKDVLKESGHDFSVTEAMLVNIFIMFGEIAKRLAEPPKPKPPGWRPEPTPDPASAKPEWRSELTPSCLSE